MEPSRTGVIIVAGGAGLRMGGGIPKQFRVLDTEPMLARTINTFARALPGAPIVVVLPADQIDYWQNLAARFEVAAHRCVAGGAERFHSVRAGIAALDEAVEWIAVHDGVRPLVSDRLIARCLACAVEHGSAVPVLSAVDSYRRTTEEGSEPVDRTVLRIVQTPQVFAAERLRAAYAATGYESGFTDDASLIERTGYPVALCEGERMNLKITTSEDLDLARVWLALRAEMTDGEEL